MRRIVCHTLIYAVVVTLVATAISRAVVAANGLGEPSVASLDHVAAIVNPSHDHHNHDSGDLWDCLQQCVDGSPDSYLMTTAALAAPRPDIKSESKLVPPPVAETFRASFRKSTSARGPPAKHFSLPTTGSRSVLLLSARLRI